MTKLSNLPVLLQDLTNSSSSIEAIVVIRPDGLSLASTLPEKLLAEKEDMIMAAILALKNLTDKECSKDSIRRIIVPDSGKYYIFNTCGDATILSIVREHIDWESLFIEIKKIIEQIINILNPAIVLESFISFPFQSTKA